MAPTGAIVHGILPFAFEGTDRPKETISPDEFDARTSIVQVGPGGVMLPKINGKIPTSQNAQFRPGRPGIADPVPVFEGADDEPGQLTPRQREVVQLLATGKSNKETAAILGRYINRAG